MKKKHSLGLWILFFCLTISIPVKAVTEVQINKARSFVRGAEERIKQILPSMFNFLKSSGLGQLGVELKALHEKIDSLKKKIEENIVSKLDPTEKTAREEKIAALEFQRVAMNLKVLDEINKIFSIQGNIAENAGKDVRDFRKTESKTSPEIEGLKKKLAQLEKQKKILLKKIKHAENILNAKLKTFYDKMKEGAGSLFKQFKNLETKMTEDASSEQATVKNTLAELEDQKKNKADKKLLEELANTKKLLAKKMQEIESSIAKEPETVVIRWGNLRDLYNRAELTKDVVLEGSEKIKNLKFEDMLRIKLPSTQKKATQKKTDKKSTKK